MVRIGNARCIADIESIIDAQNSGRDMTPWQACGVECSRNRHAFGGQTSSFEFDVLHLRFKKRSRKHWHIVIVSELRHFNGPGAEFCGDKSIRIVKGKAADVLSWIKEHGTKG